VIEQLKTAGLNVVYVELRNRPHCEVLEELSKCDFVLDELYSDTPLAGLGTEAASFGKPALVGGYGKEALQHASGELRLPMDTYSSPIELKAILERLIVDRSWRIACGENAKQFVSENWQPSMLAKRFLQLISGEVPHNWMFAPQDITYFHGWGVADDRLRERLASLIAFGGVEVLQLRDKPELEKAILEFAQSR
jgi:hypothetical protein